MRHKKILIAGLALALLLGAGYVYSEGSMLQGRFSGGGLSTTTKSTTSSSTSTKPDFYFSGDVSYDSSNNYFKVSVCQTNVASTNVKQTSLKFAVSGGQSDTVQFTPSVTTAEKCQTVNSGDLLSDLLIAQSGNYTVTATLDTTSAHTEASEANNTLITKPVVTASSYYLYDSANLPDLTVDNMEFDFTADASEYFLLATVCGLDDLLEYPSQGSLEYTFNLSQNGVTLESGRAEIYPDPFDFSSSCMEDFSIAIDDWRSVYSDLSSGTVTMNIQVDTGENTPESNEDNNGFGQTFTSEITVE